MKSLTDEMNNYIQYGTEERRWEFKPPMAWSNNQRKKKYEIAKAVFSLSNTINGGFIIFGISQKRDRSNGINFERKGLSTKQFNTFDNTDDIGRFFNEKTNQELKFEIYGGTLQIEKQGKKFIVMQVYESQGTMPVICTCDFKTEDRHCRIEKGFLYIRSMLNPIESRIIRTNEEWEELIRRLLSRKEEILYKDLQVICSNVKFTEKHKVRKKSIKSNQSTKYDKFLKRDKL
jgi:predicted HTH transcriptional regulator